MSDISNQMSVVRLQIADVSYQISDACVSRYLDPKMGGLQKQERIVFGNFSDRSHALTKRRKGTRGPSLSKLHF
jgi:hypothetical protein